MAERTVLTSDELAFINKLMHRAANGHGERTAGFRLDGGAQSNELLLALATHAELSLEAKTAEFRARSEDTALRSLWTALPSQGSAITWHYAHMLAGTQGVKPDRMIRRFVAKAL